MVKVRVRLASAAAFSVLVACIVASSLVAVPAAPAADAAPLLEARTLFLTERFSATGPARGPITGTLPENLVALRGEREGFQVAVNNTTGSTLSLSGRIVPDVALGAQQSAGTIDFEILRVGFVKLPQGSKNMGAPGMYPDPLPPLVNDVELGHLSVPGGQWGGVAVLAKVRTDAAAGPYAGTLELFTGTPGANETVYARQPFTLDVRNTTLLQPGSKKSFKTVMNVEAEAYWLQNDHMRNGVNRPFFLPADADRMAQLSGLFKFVDSRNVTPLEFTFGNPSTAGAYNCSYDSPGSVPAKSFLSQLQERYFGRARDIDPAATQFPSRLVPTHAQGCDIDSARDDFEGTEDTFRTPGVKQDDTLSPKAPAAFRATANAWKSNGLYNSSTYVKHPFDEPGDADERQQRTLTVEVPKATVALHAANGPRAKVLLAGWPRDGRGKRVCRVVAGGSQRCTNLSGDAFDNRPQWDGRGADDIDVWMPHFSRMYGRTTPSKLVKDYKVNREADYQTRLKSIRAKGKETWAYNFYTATKTMPQVSIDAPGTDPRLQYLMLARDGHTGLFISNMMLGWGAKVDRLPGSSLRRKGNPYEEATYFQHPLYGVAAGWGTFIYPGYVPELGLVGETRRNSEEAMPVSSLRMEAMRDGGEDANLMVMYRDRFGDAKLQGKMKTIFPGRNIEYPATLGNVVGPYYDNGNNLAQRMETLRRTLIAELTA